MEPSKEAIAVRITRLNRQILGKVTSGANKFNKKTIDREALLDALTVLYDECNDDPVKKSDELVRAFVDKYRSTLAELRRTRVCFSDFEILQTIGRGHFGEVHMIREKETGDVYALKTLRKEDARKQNGGAAEDERDVLANGNGPWVPKLQYAFQNNSNLYMVMELCSGGDLAGLLARRNHPMSEKDAAFYIAEVAHALKALHGMGYVHRDVKPHNIFLDRCGHVKLGDFGSCARLSEGGAGALAVGTADYVAPELLAAAECASRRHSVCLQYCRGIATTAISACDYWSLGVVAFELVTLRRPFSSGDEDSIAEILANIQKYEREPNSAPPFDSLPSGPSPEWRSLVTGLLSVAPARRFSYLDTLQHPSLTHIAMHSIRDQAPPWVPCLRGSEDASFFSPAPRVPPPPSAAPFRARPPFAGQLPFIGYSYIAPEENEDSNIGFNTSHDLTAIDLATFKSAEKLAALRAREVAALQNKLAVAEAAASSDTERIRREADSEAERTRAKLQGEITALSLQNRRLERQIEVEKEERMALQRTNQELSSSISERNSTEVRAARAQAAGLQSERDVLKGEMRRLEDRVAELQAECTRAATAAETARAQHQHYMDSVAKERALRRQTLSGGEAENRELSMRVATAEAAASRETRAREQIEKRLADLEDEYGTLQADNAAIQAELDVAKKELVAARESVQEKQRLVDVSSEQMKDFQQELAHERVKNSSLLAQVKELQRSLEEAARREASMEEQSARTEARLNERLNAAEARAAAAVADENRHREKVSKLEQLVRQLEREVSAVESRDCECDCASRPRHDAVSDTESVADLPTPRTDQPTSRTDQPTSRTDQPTSRTDLPTPRTDLHTSRTDLPVTRTELPASRTDLSAPRAALLQEQLERAEAQLQARTEEIAALRQECRSANLARWRKEREFNDLSVEAKTTLRDVKRLEDRLSYATEARKAAEQKATALETELATIKPQYERTGKEVNTLKDRLEKLQKMHETAQAEVDRSRNDIRKLKSELQYSEKRRMHAEEQEELSSRERAQLRDEMQQTRAQNNDLIQNNKALQEACSLLEEQLTDLEKLADFHEMKNKDLEGETQRLRSELESCRGRLAAAEREAAERGAAASLAEQHHQDATLDVRHAHAQLQALRDRLENRESRVAELENQVAALESSTSATEAALNSAMRRVRDLQEESSALRTRAHQEHAHALQLQAGLHDAQEETAAAREAAEAAAAWWRTRETKADATLRQQAKLIDFLQAKVEEAGRKKCSLSNKLFGRSGRRNNTSPPLRRANRELREEVERLRAQLAARNGDNDCPVYAATPKREKPKTVVNMRKSIDTPDGPQDNSSVQLVWEDGGRDRMQCHCADGRLILADGERRLRARVHSEDAKLLLQNEANKAFTVKMESPARYSEAIVVCNSISARNELLRELRNSGAPSVGYAPAPLCVMQSEPLTALYIAANVIAIGCRDGLRSLRGAVHVEWAGEGRRAGGGGGVSLAATCGPRVLACCGDALGHGAALAAGSALRRAPALRPALALAPVHLPADGPHLLQTISGHQPHENPCIVVACGRRVFLLRYDASQTEFKIARSFTVDRPPHSLLLTTSALYIAGEKPLKILLPSGALESFGMDEPILAAAARKHSPPKAILLIRENPTEILLCYAECGVFVDENGKRTRQEDPKWSSAIHSWQFVRPFLYLVGDDKITILYINDEVYRAPPCTCDTASMTSSASECYSPEIFNLKIRGSSLLGTSPHGIIIGYKDDEGYKVTLVEGVAAFRSVGASLESLETMPDSKRSSSDLCQSMTDLLPQDVSRVSQESVEATTGFLADIRKKAKQLRKKNRAEQSPDDVIKQILTTEVGLKRGNTGGRKSPASASEFDSDSTDSEETTDSTKGTNDLCAEMFARQVRFQ